MLRRRRRTCTLTPLVLAASLLPGGCSDSSSSTEIEEQFVGTWSLSQVNGRPLPVDYGGVCFGFNNQAVAAPFIAMAGSLKLETNRRFLIDVTYEYQCPQQSRLRSQAPGSGVWEVDTDHPDVLVLMFGSTGNEVHAAGTVSAPLANNSVSFSATLPGSIGHLSTPSRVTTLLTFSR